MASIEQRNGIFRIVFRFQGRRFSQSLGTNDEAAAVGIKTAVEQRIKLIKSKLLPGPSVGEDVVEFLMHGKSQPDKTGIIEKAQQKAEISFGGICKRYFDNFLRSSVEDASFQTLELHRRHLLRHIGADKKARAVNARVSQKYINLRSKDPGIRGGCVSPATIKKEITTLKTIFRWAKDEELIESEFSTKGLRFPKGKEKPPFQTMEEIRRKIECGGLAEQQADEHWDCLFLSTKEIADLLSDVKSNALRIVLAGWLESHPAGPYLFTLEPAISRSKKNRKIGQSISHDEAHSHFRSTLQGTKWNNIRGWHCLRHSFCSNCAAVGIEQRVINQWVGHQTEEMVRRYRHLFPHREREAIETVFG